VHSVLFVPGSRPERFVKALASAAHLVCIDLEDAVALDDKAKAREATLAFLMDAPLERLAVRINTIKGRTGLSDLLALAQAPRYPPFILLPKVEAAAELTIVAGAFCDPRVRLVPIVESVNGLANVMEIARAPGCAAVVFGGADFASDIGVSLAWEPLFAARAAIVQACARAGVVAIDVPFIDVNDESGLEQETRRVKGLGFSAKAAIHPKQVEPINRVFAPTAEEVAEARAALAAFRASNGAAVQFKGKLLEAPIVRGYERVLASIAREHVDGAVTDAGTSANG
jgi:citrate lyase beta subunit